MSKNTAKAMSQEESVELFQLELTKTQLKALSSLLPQGFSLEPVPKTNTKISSKPTKKVFTNDKKPVANKSAQSTNFLQAESVAKKPGLRDPGKRKPSTQFEFPDYEPNHSVNRSFKSNTHMARKCQNLLQKLKKHPSAGPFLYPVDVKGLGLVDYYSIVQEPMDLSTVENKLKKGQYASLDDYTDDIRKIWNNSLLYNMEGSAIYVMTLEMRSYFERLLQDIDNLKSNDAVRNLEKKVELLTRQLSELHQVDFPAVRSPNPLQMNRSVSKSSNRNKKLMEKPMTIQEKKTLGQNIQKLSPEHIRGLWEILSQRMHLSGTSQEELEIDLESLPTSVARELEKYVKNKMSLMNRGKNKAKAKEATVQMQGAFGNYKQQEGYFEGVSKGEDEVTTQHHSITGSDGVPDFREEVNTKEDDILSNSSASSFISDSDSEDGNENKDILNYNDGKARQQDHGKFLTVGNGFGSH